MSKKRPKNSYVDAEAAEDSGEESDTEKKQRAAAIKKLKSNRTSKSFYSNDERFRDDLGATVLVINEDTDEDDEDVDEMDEATAKEFQNFIAEQDEEV